MKRLLYLTVILSMALAAPTHADDLPDIDEAFSKDILVIETADNGCFKFDVYIAVTNAQQQRGLMFVRYLPEWSGMLFLYQPAGIRSMWMKNTYIPLDILFARADGTVSSIESNTEPLSLKSISAIEPVGFVLELNAGTATRLGIEAGSRLVLEQPEQ